MIEWIDTTVGEFSPFTYGKGLPERERKSGSVKVFGSGGISGYHNESLVKNKGIIIGRKGTIGSIKLSEEPFFPIDTVFYIENESSKRDLKFAYYLLQTLGLEKMNNDSAVPGLNREQAHSIKIRIPKKIEHQKLIAKKLSILDDKIELNNQINATLESMTKAIFKEWFIDFSPVKAKAEGKKPFGIDDKTTVLFPDAFEDSEFGLIPKNWKYVTCKDFGNIVTGTTPPSAKVEFMGNFLPFVTPSDYSSEVFVTNTSRHLSETGYHSFQNRIAKPNSVMVTSIGSDLGKVALSACEVLTNQQINTISVKESFYSHYLYLHFANQQKYLKSIAGGSATPIINKSQFEDLNILMPKREIILEFDKIIKPIFQLILFNQYEIKTLRTTRDLLLPKLISGELHLNEVICD